MALGGSKVKGSVSLVVPLVWIDGTPIDQDHQGFLVTNLLETFCNLRENSKVRISKKKKTTKEEEDKKKKEGNKRCGGRSCLESQRRGQSHDREGQ